MRPSSVDIARCVPWRPRASPTRPFPAGREAGSCVGAIMKRCCSLSSAHLEPGCTSHISVVCVHFSIWFGTVGGETLRLTFFPSRMMASMIKVCSSLKKHSHSDPFFFFFLHLSIISHKCGICLLLDKPLVLSPHLSGKLPVREL